MFVFCVFYVFVFMSVCRFMFSRCVCVFNKTVFFLLLCVMGGYCDVLIA